MLEKNNTLQLRVSWVLRVSRVSQKAESLKSPRHPSPPTSCHISRSHQKEEKPWQT